MRVLPGGVNLGFVPTGPWLHWVVDCALMILSRVVEHIPDSEGAALAVQKEIVIQRAKPVIAPCISARL